MLLDRKAVRRNFDRAASSYLNAAAIAHEVHTRLSERLALVKLGPLRVVDLGGGGNRDTAMLTRRFPKASVTIADLSPGMLCATRRALPWYAPLLATLRARRTSMICADMHRLPFATGSIDLLWSNLTLPWAIDLPAALQECARVLTPGGLFMFSSCGPDTLRELRQLPDGGAHVHTFPDMHDVGDGLMRAGLADPVMEMDKLSVTYSGWPALRKELRQIGAGNALRVRPRGLGGRRFASELRDLRPNPDGKLSVTVEVVYGHAWKALPRPRAAGAGTQSVVRLHRPQTQQTKPE